MNIIDIPDIQNLIKSYITDNPLSPDIIKQYLISKKYKELVFPSVIEDIIFSYNPITFFDLFIKNKIPTQDLDYDNFNYIELSKNPKTYPFIKYLLRELNPSVDVDSKLITELKNKPPLMDGVSVFYSHEYRLCKSLIKNYKKNAGKKYHEFWININKYDSKFIILDDKKNRKHISFNIKNPYVNENFVKIIKNKFFGNIENIDLESINIFLKLYDIHIRRTEDIIFILCRCNNNKIHKYIKHIINKKKIKIIDRLIENLCYSKNKLAHSTIHNFLEEKSILGFNCTYFIYINKILPLFSP